MEEYKFSFYKPSEKVPLPFSRVLVFFGNNYYSCYFYDNSIGKYFLTDYGDRIMFESVKEWSYMES